MKKQDIFLLAYIAFIMVCVVVHQIGNYPMWESTVAAVSFSSIFLAYADAFLTVSKGFLKLCDTRISAINIINKILSAEKGALEEISKLISSVPKDKFDVSKTEGSFDEMVKRHEELKTEVSDLKTEHKKSLQRAKGIGYASNIMYFFGFFSFLCIMSFYPITEETNELQTVVSVIAFVIVLSTQLFDSLFDTIIDKRKKQVENKNFFINKKIEELEDEKQKIRDFVKAFSN